MTPWLSFVLRFNIVITLVFILYRISFSSLSFYRWNRLFFLLGIFFYPIATLIFFPLLQLTTLHVYLPAEKMMPAFLTPAPGSDTNTLVKITGLLLGVGSAIVFIRLLVNLLLMRNLLHKAVSVEKQGKRIHIYDFMQPVSPFSFFNNICISRKMYTEGELNDILAHEKYHIAQWHFFDLISGELMCAICWLNPLSWLLKRIMIQNLEFETDSAIIRAPGHEPEAYQLSLLRVCNNTAPVLTHMHFNTSDLKKRIYRINKDASAGIQRFRYMLVIPLFLMLVLCFHEPVHQRNNFANLYDPIQKKINSLTQSDLAKEMPLPKRVNYQRIAGTGFHRQYHYVEHTITTMQTTVSKNVHQEYHRSEQSN
jgi:hypothetical protein